MERAREAESFHVLILRDRRFNIDEKLSGTASAHLYLIGNITCVRATSESHSDTSHISACDSHTTPLTTSVDTSKFFCWRVIPTEVQISLVEKRSVANLNQFESVRALLEQGAETSMMSWQSH